MAKLRTWTPFSPSPDSMACVCWKMHLGGGGARHLTPVAKARVLEYWRRLIAGEIEQLLAEPWRPGYQE